MNKTYRHTDTESEIYEYWQNLGLFSPEKSKETRKKYGLQNKKETFTVLMPPPNANAPLHCGHATYAIQDIMARVKRMQGYETLYLPGTDHAGFETQVVYERKLKEKGKSRFDFDRDTFYKQVLDFVKQNSGLATSQLKNLGMSADWGRLTFMLDDHVVNTVYDTFEKMHQDGLVYRDTYMVNYSTFHGTTFSNLETTHKESITSLYYINYRIKDSEEIITVATVRPETIYADVAVAVNPDDSRYEKLVGKTALNPLNRQEMPIIKDDYVDPEFGTGALKITPGHDFNDYEVGKRHNLPIVTVINLEGKMKNNAPEVEGMYTKPARKKVEQILKEKGALEKIDEKYKHNLLVDYKDKREIEPLPLPNWFLKMEDLTKPAVEAIKEEKVKFYKPMWKREILRWLEDIHDWPISRQIVFGIKMPVWYSVKDNPDLFVVFLDKAGTTQEGRVQELLKETDLETIRKGLQKIVAPVDAKYKISRTLPEEEYLQETDTFDTWFSSGQWPLTTLGYPESEDFQKFFPTDFMDTMWDILFFWIARMTIFSLYLTDKVPFKNVYIHGAITDEKGQKMSKSKGNVINPMDFVEKYGADALRMGIIVGGNTAAKETALSEDKVRGYRNFANKIWNMARFMQLMKEESGVETKPLENLDLEPEDEQILNKLDDLIKEVNRTINKHRLADAGEAVYQFMWHTLADEFIESIKDREDKQTALSVLDHVYKECIKLLHPFMPFITEKIWQEIAESAQTEPLMISDWPVVRSEKA
jgi:valyl-tRNA synthetase